tara:strand:- start:338 stop:1504 length:1167 start_codon:yes stop_codon:yes gene_type:complete
VAESSQVSVEGSNTKTQQPSPTSGQITKLQYPSNIDQAQGGTGSFSQSDGYLHTINIQIINSSGGGASNSTTEGGDSPAGGSTESGDGNGNAQPNAEGGGVVDAISTTAGNIVDRVSTPPSTSLGADITLIMTNAVENRMSAQWDSTDFGLLGTAIEARRKGESLQDVLNNIADNPAAGGELAVRKAAALLNIGKQLGINLPADDAIQVLTRKVENPFKEQLFKTMNFRSFPMQVKFAPRSSAEMSNVMNILYELERAMHPEREQIFLRYPSEFKIEYRYNGAKNSYLNTINNCVLTDMQVNYGHNGFMTSFEGGAPTEITLNLNFKEVLLRDRKQIKPYGGGGGGGGQAGTNDRNGEAAQAAEAQAIDQKIEAGDSGSISDGTGGGE